MLGAVNIVEAIERRMDPGRPALWRLGEVIEFGALFERVGEVAAELRRWGAWRAAAVPRIGLLGDNGPDYVVAALAVLKAGGCFVPVAGELAAPERAAVAETTGLHGVLVLDGHDWPGGCAPVGGWRGLRGRVIEPGAVRFPVAEFEALGPAFIRFSSGTTGRSKGVVLTHRSLLERIKSANQWLGIGPDDRVLWLLPMAHHFAVSIVLYLHFGALTVIEAGHMAAEWLDAAERSGATVVYGAPFHHALLAADAGAFRWPSLRLAVSTAAPLPAAVARRFRSRYGRPLVQGLGVIECGLPVLNLAAAVDKPESIGRPLPGWDAELRDPDDLAAAAGEAGELWLRGPGMFDAYLDPWQPRAAATRDGWFDTGDLCERDADGELRLMGRRKSVINVGGMKAFPEEIEAVLDRQPAVGRSRVHARPHPWFGAVPVAEVVPGAGGAPPDPAQLRSACRAALAPHKVPVAIEVVDWLPLTASGKLRR